MFAFINNNTQVPFTLNTTKFRNISNDNDQIISFSPKVVGYLDDTSWFAHSLADLETFLNLSSEFYKFENVHINIDKYEILTNVKKRQNQDITLNINNMIIHTKTGARSQGKTPSKPEGYYHSITAFYPDFTTTDISSLRNKRITFASQVTTKDGMYLLPYLETEAINHRGNIPKWYEKLQTECSIGPNQVLISPLENPVITSLPVSHIPNESTKTYYRHRTKIWVYYWDPKINNVIIGRIIEIYNPSHGIPTNIGYIHLSNKIDKHRNNSSNLIPVTDTPYYTPSRIDTNSLISSPSTITDPIIANTFIGFPSTLSCLQDIRFLNQTTSNLFFSPMIQSNTSPLKIVESVSDGSKPARMTTQQSLKTNNYLLWFILKNYIRDNNLTVILNKVTVHSNNISNDMADHLAKFGCDVPQPIIINPRNLTSSMGNLTWNNLGIVDKSVRKWGKSLYASKSFNEFLNNTSLEPLLDLAKTHPIDFTSTHQWFQQIPDDLCLQLKQNSYQGRKIKEANFILPTGDQQQAFYPDLYSNHLILCQLCHMAVDQNEHIGNCDSYLTPVK
ncbi:hypothetical protein C1645_821846 [Glomus cerebriforme]|uniref:Reverse transcriptase domain-containing protein n=1 Tax=Glomus cerebriforme TaxID=658196 RepID=A0A397T2P7_9GLOM|nr:hypothetical protein C1645_821846 [Glomus cerebriforme]